MSHTTRRGRRAARRAIERLRARGERAALGGAMLAATGHMGPAEVALSQLRRINDSIARLYARVER